MEVVGSKGELEFESEMEIPAETDEMTLPAERSSTVMVLEIL
jgi:hypothetical protein